MAAKLRSLCLAALLFRSGLAFYVPGVAPQDFKKGEPIEVRAIKMTSSHTQLPFEYYSLPFCKPSSGEVEYKSQNLGEILRGDRISGTAYDLKMNTPVKCKALCFDHNKKVSYRSKIVSTNVKMYQEFYYFCIVD